MKKIIIIILLCLCENLYSEVFEADLEIETRKYSVGDIIRFESNIFSDPLWYNKHEHGDVFDYEYLITVVYPWFEGYIIDVTYIGGTRYNGEKYEVMDCYDASSDESLFCQMKYYVGKEPFCFYKWVPAYNETERVYEILKLNVKNIYPNGFDIEAEEFKPE